MSRAECLYRLIMVAAGHVATIELLFVDGRYRCQMATAESTRHWSSPGWRSAPSTFKEFSQCHWPRSSCPPLDVRSNMIVIGLAVLSEWS